MIANRGKMAFHFLKIMPRAASEVKVSRGNGWFLVRKNPSSKKYLNYNNLSSLSRHFIFHLQGIPFNKIAPFPRIKKYIIKSAYNLIVDSASILLRKRMVRQQAREPFWLDSI
jgi:hypothetical protein